MDLYYAGPAHSSHTPLTTAGEEVDDLDRDYMIYLIYLYATCEDLLRLFTGRRTKKVTTTAKHVHCVIAEDGINWCPSCTQCKQGVVYTCGMWAQHDIYSRCWALTLLLGDKMVDNTKMTIVVVGIP